MRRLQLQKQHSLVAKPRRQQTNGLHLKYAFYNAALKGSGVASNLKKEVLKIIYPIVDKKEG
jgi:hypothetical protein